jgi:hypothetical protein
MRVLGGHLDQPAFIISSKSLAMRKSLLVPYRLLLFFGTPVRVQAFLVICNTLIKINADAIR